jgi:hypothetical protein
MENGVVYQWYTDTTRPSPGLYLTTSTDMIHWSAPVFTQVGLLSVDVKYDDAHGHFVMVAMPNQHGPTASVATMHSVDGVTWTAATELFSAASFPDWANNIGISGDIQGHLIPGTILVGFGAPYDAKLTFNNDCKVSPAPYCWGFWDLYGMLTNTANL